MIPTTNVKVSGRFYETHKVSTMEQVLGRFHRNEVMLPLALARRLLVESEWRQFGNGLSCVSGQVIGYRLDSKPIGKALEVFDPSTERLRVIDCIPKTVVVNGKEVDLTKELGYVVSINPVKIDSQGNIVLSDGRPVWQYDVREEDYRTVFTPINEEALIVTPLVHSYGDSNPISGLPDRVVAGSVLGSVKMNLDLAGRAAFVGLPVFRNRFETGGICIDMKFTSGVGVLIADIVMVRSTEAVA